MPREPALPPAIEQAMARGLTVLTANQRAARTLRHAYDTRQRELGHSSWQPPAILAWDSWTASLWHRLLVDGHTDELVLNPSQEHAVWRELLAADREASATATTPRLLDSLAELAARAWSTLHAYRGRNRLSAYADTADTRAFARWADAFDRRAERSRYLTSAELPEALRKAASDRTLSLTEPGLLLVGFDQRTPAQSALLEAFTAQDITLEEHTPQSHPEASLISTATQQAELSTCARWLHAQLIDNPTARLAVIVPDLASNRAALDRTLRQTLAPELAAIHTPIATGPFEFSLGVPLGHTPLAATALDLLRWACEPLPLDRVSALLLSPHFAGAAEAEHLARAEFDAFTLRRASLLEPTLSLESLYTLASDSRSSAALPTLVRHLRELRTEARSLDLTTSRTHAEQAAAIHTLLEAAGWSNHAHDSSVEYQARRRWESALDELASLDFNNRRIPFAESLDELERIAARTLFAPESRHAPVQIMGPLEAAGSAFDAVWFLDAGDLAWPATPSPNPLLGWRLQRELTMPGVDPAHDLDHARRVTSRIAASASTVILSYAQQTSSGRQRPSTALTGLTLTTRSETFAHETLSPLTLEELHDDAFIPPPPPGQSVRGGASVLAAQAACGFRAFAEHRLFSSALDSRELGLDPAERGILVHKALERFWTEVQSQAALKALTTPQRDAILTRAIDHTLSRHDRTAEGWSLAYLDTERVRLLRLLRDWLDFEATRSPFTVASLEHTLPAVAIGPLLLDVRVDRIDHIEPVNEDESPGDLILDYKTGRAHPNDWQGDRPDAPQLPLYAVVADAAVVADSTSPTDDDATPHLAGIAFASVRTGNIAFNGYQSEKGVLPRATQMKAPSLDEQVEQWRGVLTTLAEDFSAGRASVAPKQYPTTCRNCDQRLLCRLDTSTIRADALEDFLDDTESATEASRG